MRIHGGGKKHIPQAHHKVGNQNGKQRSIVHQHGDADELTAAGVSQDAHDKRFDGRNVGLLTQDAAGQSQKQVTDINGHGPLDYFFIKMQNENRPFINTEFYCNPGCVFRKQMERKHKLILSASP